MGRNSKLETSESGQALLICVLIGMVLLLTIPVIVFVNMSGAKHHVAALKHDKAAAIAEEGLATAIKVLSYNIPPSNPPTVWTNALNGTFLATPECNGVVDLIVTNGGHFRLNCASQASGGCPASKPCERYQVYVKATAYMPDPGQPANFVPAYNIEAYLSRRTIAAVLPTGLTAPAALRLANVPSIDPLTNLGSLDVWWGPIVLTANAAWTVKDYTPPFLISTMDTHRYPRKFSAGPITGANAAYPRSGPGIVSGTGLIPDPNKPISDKQEYWAFTSVGFPTIDLAAYQALAAAPNSCPTEPTGCAGTNCQAVPRYSCYFPNVGTDTALFTGLPLLPYALGAPYGSVLYVDGGNAQFTNVSLDVHAGGAVIVTGNGNPTTGNLTLGAKTGSRTPITMHVPATASLNEYPYAPPGPQALPVPQASHIFGFVYVGNDLTVMPAPGSLDVKQWEITGVVVVDGTLNVAANAGLLVRYDDQVNRKILMPDPFQLMIDSQREVTAN